MLTRRSLLAATFLTPAAARRRKRRKPVGWGGAWSNQIVDVVIIDAAGNATGLFVFAPTVGPGKLSP